MKNMNVPVEVKSGLKQLKSSVEVENKLMSVLPIAGGKSPKSIADNLKSRFVYRVCGYHITSIPSQLQPKPEFAHPSPLFPNISTKKHTSTIDNPSLIIDKLTRLFSRLFMQSISRLSIQSLYVCNNLNNSQSGTTSTNDISSNSQDNEDNLQSINIENELYDNRLGDYTYNNMILSNITKI